MRRDAAFRSFPPASDRLQRLFKSEPYARAEAIGMRDHVERWPLQCGECGDRIFVGRPVREDEEPTGTAECRRGHIVLFRYDGETLFEGEASRDEA